MKTKNFCFDFKPWKKLKKKKTIKILNRYYIFQSLIEIEIYNPSKLITHIVFENSMHVEIFFVLYYR